MTIISDVFHPELLTDALEGVFGGQTAFMGSLLASLGVVVVDGSMPEGGEDAVGTSIKVPYFSTLGEFVDNPDGTALAQFNSIRQMNEESFITRDSLGFSVSRWARANSKVNPKIKDPYVESARQMMVAAERAMDRRIIDAATAPGVYVKDVYSASAPKGLDWDLCVDAKFDGWGDEQSGIAAILVHSQAHKDLMKLKDSTGRPLLLQSQKEGGPLDLFCGVPVVVSDRVPLTGSAMGAVSASGSAPPVATIAGTPLGAYRLVIDCVLGGAHQTATIRFSVDGGNIWSDPIVTAAATVALPLIDPAIDSRVGMNGKTGLTVSFAAGTFNADNLWTSSASLRVESLLLKKSALAFWYSRHHLALETDKNIRSHTDEAASHLYAVAHRYRRAPGSTTKPGVIKIAHNVLSFT